MKLQFKAAFSIFAVGVASLLITAAVYDYNGHKVSLKDSLKKTRSISVEMAEQINTHLEDRATISLTLASAPSIKEALVKSNQEFGLLTNKARQQKITDLNQQWMDTENSDDPFIRNRMTNPVADYLNHQRALFPGMYGELFLTNRYGVMISTTGKLTTLAHAHKYWWVGSHDRGRVFFDDRGFDASVQGYVLGIAVPVKSDGNIIGILKCNINILGPLHHIIEDFKYVTNGELKIVRSGGAVVIESDVPPLSTTLSEAMSSLLQSRETGTAFIQQDDKKYLVAYTPIPLTMGTDKIAFGGSSKSLDHIMGNKGEGWHAVIFYDEVEATQAIRSAEYRLVLMGFFMVIAMVLLALALGKKMVAPIERLAASAVEIGKGNFDISLKVKSHDEIGKLADAFNQMAQNLKATTASRDELVREIEQRKRAEEQRERMILDLQVALSEIKTLRGLFPICAHCKKIRDEKGYWNRIESYIEAHSEVKFSHGLCETCSDDLYGDETWYKEMKRNREGSV